MAKGFEARGFKCVLYGNDGVQISDYNGLKKDVVIPKEIKKLKCRKIGNLTFEKTKKLTSVTIPDTVIFIGVKAFYGCTSLTEINIPNSVRSIGHDAFLKTPFLVNQRTVVKYAGRWAVDCAKDVKTVEIKEGTLGISDEAFCNCKWLKSITIPVSLIRIGEGAFSGCLNLENVIVSCSEGIICCMSPEMYLKENVVIGEDNEYLTNAGVRLSYSLDRETGVGNLATSKEISKRKGKRTEAKEFTTFFELDLNELLKK